MRRKTFGMNTQIDFAFSPFVFFGKRFFGAVQILQIIHPVEECSETLAFATEPVFASLANILAYQV